MKIFTPLFAFTLLDFDIPILETNKKYFYRVEHHAAAGSDTCPRYRGMRIKGTTLLGLFNLKLQETGFSDLDAVGH